MKAMITGMNGTVAPYVYKELKKRNIDVVIWNREEVSIDSEKVVFDFIKETNPDLFFHIATGPVEWIKYIAKATNELGVKLLFTSSVSVFSEKGTGPYDIQSVPNSEEDYGRYKIAGENSVKEHNPDAFITRLGWQIGSTTGSNDMFDFLEKEQEENGFIEASSKWYPSCSFLKDTAKTIVDVALEYKPDTYLVNSNKNYSFYDIVNHLKEKNRTNWEIHEIISFVRDDRMYDNRIKIKDLF
ncbi:sugar nucleotide-binding protein [Lacticigenium naphthae]|uniref:sugar nucleotide-binding protein n=1 Tax=Lacticigenium naphthae TaxID=515351 RepID=UPI0004162B46|nr:sugar nucleotide-binding protein [Lacticigenium naphthae]